MTKQIQQYTGNVVSTKMSKTVVVAVKSTKIHSKYKKQYTSVKKYMAHYDESEPLEIGQEVKIVSIRPISKNKKWQIVK
ncbi:MAG: hypothetical protein OHK0017_03180 [Patescibacteria group bacterium]